MARRAAALPTGVGTTLPVFAVRASGGIVEDVDGNRFIDLAAGIAVTTVGSAAPRVVAAVTEQVERFTHTCFQVTPYESYVAVCERLNALTPGDHEKRSFLVNSGAEAVENAVKIARYVTGRDAVIAFDHGFHGRTLMGMTLTGKVMPYKQGFGPFAPEVYRAEYSYPFRGTGDLASTLALLDKTVGASQDRLHRGRADRRRGRLHRAGAGLAGRARARGARTTARCSSPTRSRPASPAPVRGSPASTKGVVPDIVATAKGLGGGLPIAGVTARAELIDQVHAGGLGGTFGGNPLSCAAALAAIETIEADGLLERARVIGDLMTTRLHAIAASHPSIGEVRGRGAMIAIELVGADGITPDAELTKRLAAACHADGVLVLTAGSYGNVLRFLPPLSISDELLDDALGVLEKAFAQLTQ